MIMTMNKTHYTEEDFGRIRRLRKDLVFLCGYDALNERDKLILSKVHSIAFGDAMDGVARLRDFEDRGSVGLEPSQLLVRLRESTLGNRESLESYIKFVNRTAYERWKFLYSEQRVEDYVHLMEIIREVDFETLRINGEGLQNEMR